MRAALLFTLALAACQPEEVTPDEVGLEEGDISTARIIEEGTPEAAGVLAMLNAAATTLTVLDDGAGLDRRAATNLIAHRDGATSAAGDDDAFDTIAEVDAVAYVGDSALSALLAYAIANGWVAVGDDYYGTIETVSFTKDEAAGVVDLANTATQADLDVAVGLDARAATAIVATRPFTTVEQVAAVSYVGTSALNLMKDWVNAEPLPGTDAVLAELETVVEGLWYTSESDYVLTPFAIRAPATTTLTTSNLKTVIASAYVARADARSLAARSVQKSSLSRMFDRYTVAQDWWDDSYLAEQPKWQAVRDVFEDDLTNVTVWRLGRKDSSGQLTGDIDVWAIGVSADGDLVGVWTISIET